MQGTKKPSRAARSGATPPDGSEAKQVLYRPKDVIITPLANSAPVIQSTGKKQSRVAQESEDIDEVFLDEYLSPPKLRELANTHDLSKVKHLDMCVDAVENTLGRFGDHMPNLKELKLNDSRIQSFRNLGTSLAKIEILWIARCQVDDLAGISSMPYLKELYVAFNQISDLSPLSGMEYLEVLDLECNSIEGVDTIGLLSTCPKLCVLTLENNPVCQVPHYRKLVCRAIKTLKIMDDRTVSADDRKKPPESAITTASQKEIKDESSLIEAVLKYGKVDIDEMSIESVTKLLSTTESRPGTPLQNSSSNSSRSQSANRPSTANSMKPSAVSRPTSASTSKSRTPTPFEGTLDEPGFMDDLEDDISSKLSEMAGLSESSSSHLTHGSDDVFCGNPVVALRGRKAGGAPNETRSRPSTQESMYSAPKLPEIKSSSDGFDDSMQTRPPRSSSEPRKRQSSAQSAIQTSDMEQKSNAILGGKPVPAIKPRPSRSKSRDVSRPPGADSPVS